MNDRKAGVLVERHTGSGYIFRYDENYLASDGPAISVTMPKLRVPLESEILITILCAKVRLLIENKECLVLKVTENMYNIRNILHLCQSMKACDE